jgi:hypothetical protein
MESLTLIENGMYKIKVVEGQVGKAEDKALPSVIQGHGNIFLVMGAKLHLPKI